MLSDLRAAHAAGSKLEAALLANAIKLSKNAAAGLPETWALVQVEFAATNFASFSAAAGPSIHKFLHQATKQAVASMQDQPSFKDVEALAADAQVSLVAQGQSAAADPLPAESQHLRHISSSTDMQTSSEARPSAAAMHGSALPAEGRVDEGCSPSPGCSKVDVEQQRQLLRDIQVRNSLARTEGSSHLGLKRTRLATQHKPGAKHSKSEHTTGPGQRTITSLFAKGR